MRVLLTALSLACSMRATHGFGGSMFEGSMLSPTTIGRKVTKDVPQIAPPRVEEDDATLDATLTPTTIGRPVLLMEGTTTSNAHAAPVLFMENIPTAPELNLGPKTMGQGVVVVDAINAVEDGDAVNANMLSPTTIGRQVVVVTKEDADAPPPEEMVPDTTTTTTTTLATAPNKKVVDPINAVEDDSSVNANMLSATTIGRQVVVTKDNVSPPVVVPPVTRQETDAAPKKIKAVDPINAVEDESCVNSNLLLATTIGRQVTKDVPPVLSSIDYVPNDAIANVMFMEDIPITPEMNLGRSDRMESTASLNAYHAIDTAVVMEEEETNANAVDAVLEEETDTAAVLEEEPASVVDDINAARQAATVVALEDTRAPPPAVMSAQELADLAHTARRITSPNEALQLEDTLSRQHMVLQDRMHQIKTLLLTSDSDTDDDKKKTTTTAFTKKKKPAFITTTDCLSHADFNAMVQLLQEDEEDEDTTMHLESVLCAEGELCASACSVMEQALETLFSGGPATVAVAPEVVVEQQEQQDAKILEEDIDQLLASLSDVLEEPAPDAQDVDGLLSSIQTFLHEDDQMISSIQDVVEEHHNNKIGLENE